MRRWRKLAWWSPKQTDAKRKNGDYQWGERGSQRWWPTRAITVMSGNGGELAEVETPKLCHRRAENVGLAEMERQGRRNDRPCMPVPGGYPWSARQEVAGRPGSGSNGILRISSIPEGLDRLYVKGWRKRSQEASLIQAAACNLALLMRALYGAGKPRAAHDCWKSSPLRFCCGLRC